MEVEPIGERVASIEARQSDFDRWNEKQNGRLDRIDHKLDASRLWLIGLMGTMLVGVTLTAINLAVH